MGATRELEARQRQLEVYARGGKRPFVPLSASEREQQHAAILKNLGNTLGDSQCSGREVDLLVAAYEHGHPAEPWVALERWMFQYAWGRTAAAFDEPPAKPEVEDVFGDARARVVRGIAARSALAVGTPMTADALIAWHHCFTHTFPFRPWIARIITNLALDHAKRRHPPGGASAAVPDGAIDAPAGGATVEDEADGAIAKHRVPDVLRLIVAQHKRGERRADHLRHTLARLPRRYAAAIDLAAPSLGIMRLPVARSDAQMAVNIGTSVSNVESTRDNYRKFVAKRHPHLDGTLSFLLELALSRHASGGS